MAPTPPVYQALNEIAALAEYWAYQPTDYDEDTEQQIADGNEILAILERLGLPGKRPKPPMADLNPLWIEHLGHREPIRDCRYCNGKEE